MEKEFSSRKWILEELEKKDFIFADCWKAVRTWEVVVNKYGGHTEKELSFHLMTDGSLILMDDDEMLNIQPEQITVLKELLLLIK